MTLDEIKACYTAKTMTMDEFNEEEKLIKEGVLSATGVSKERLKEIENIRNDIRKKYPNEKDYIAAYFKENK